MTIKEVKKKKKNYDLTLDIVINMPVENMNGVVKIKYE